MDKTKLQNKAINDLIKDAEDGRVKKESVKKAKAAVKKPAYTFLGKHYDSLEAIAEDRKISLDDVKYYLDKGEVKENK